ncbi:hypothetical protein H2202_008831 [Exophiala xenobiotica]|nr:hypothetical protein H2202_008831 [Exophiala xenobiotica]KAK5212336.1 hypothetical protein LTR41_002578 [Exophiala xenobiotica]KAK5219580.1 hypothetical protein LTR72_007964 [Exophiala xenobiotica]KAK5231712.1 hypothetical protein LTR47_007115 [Exophiala xenobiotica]KAK5252473.1 hypothetical protein LTS06_002880 [Exophiala xenobiotica]
MSFNNFDTLPHSASKTIKPFNVAIPQQDLDNLTTLLKLSRLPPPTYENSLPGGGGPRLGLRRDWLSAAKQHWETEFDWRKYEQHINTFPHFIAPISIHIADHDDRDHHHDHDHGQTDSDMDTITSTTMDITMDIHFVALFSHRHDAIPILLLHGWPGSFLEFLPILSHLRSQYTADTLPYHVIVPSLPGYAFSTSPPWNATFRPADAARVFDTLATTALGFKSYMVQGGDLGGRIARIIAATYPKCKAVHLNTHPMLAPDASVRLQSAINDTEQAGLERHNFFLHNGTAYAFEHATRPATIGAVLSSNPLALLAWIGEKFLDWTDDPHPSLDTILESVTLYWLTNCAATSLYSYRAFYGPNADSHGSPKWHIPHNKPLGYSWFPKEINPIPRAWIETTGNLVFYRQHEKGGHFAALERPEDLWADVDEFAQRVKYVFNS